MGRAISFWHLHISESALLQEDCGGKERVGGGRGESLENCTYHKFAPMRGFAV